VRFIFKTSYDQDIRLFQHGGQTFWYGLLAAALLAAPALASEYYLSQLTFICIYAIVGVGLMLLTGYTGQVSLGHAAFLAVGAYTEAVLQAHGVPFGLSIAAAAALAGLAGVGIGLPALRLTGIYLVIATMAFGFIVQEGLTRWESVTRGNLGMTLRSIDLFGVRVDEEWKLYYLALAMLTLVVIGVRNLLRAPTGRAFVAIRDSEISAQSMGIHLARYKTTSFALSAAITGLAGALYAHKLQFISPEQFGIILSIELAMMIFIGGIGSLHGAIYGAIFIIALPQLIAIAKDYVPSAIAHQTGLEPTIFGLILVLVIVFEPFGIYGRWLKVRHYLQTFPLYKQDTFRRQKMFMKSERAR
jgi:branched-chain amino acid transport system permease protein